MALRNQPYIPLFVDDVLCDEKLVLCSAEAHGVYFRLLCILHKQETYGKICLKQNHKQSKDKSKFFAFALLLARQMPFEAKQIEASLAELCEERIIEVTDNELSQKRMVRDGTASLAKSDFGKLGGAHSVKQYGKSGKLFWMSDYANKHKVGTSINSQNRLYRIRSDYKLKTFDIIKEISVKDMGIAEDFAIEIFKEKFDGEFINMPYQDMEKLFGSLLTKTEAKDEQNPGIGIGNTNTSTNSDNVKYSNIKEFALPKAKEEQSKEQNKNNEQIDETEINKRRYENFKIFLLNQRIWCEEVCMKTKSTLDQLPEMIDNFISHCIFGGETHYSEKEFQTHFRNVCLSKLSIVKPKNDPTNVNYEIKIEKFRQEVALYQNQYDGKMLEAFFNHWSQLDSETNLMLWEKEKAFEISKRLISWKENGKNFKKNGNSKEDREAGIRNALEKRLGQ